MDSVADTNGDALCFGSATVRLSWDTADVGETTKHLRVPAPALTAEAHL